MYIILSSLQIENGIVHCSESVSLEPESCVFHEDDSGRIVHVGASQVRYVFCLFFLLQIEVVYFLPDFLRLF